MVDLDKDPPGLVEAQANRLRWVLAGLGLLLLAAIFWPAVLFISLWIEFASLCKDDSYFQPAGHIGLLGTLVAVGYVILESSSAF